MTPEDVVTELSVQLRRHGVLADRAALEALAARLRRESAADPDIKEAARRFSEGCGAAWGALAKKRLKALMNGASFCVAGAGFVFLALAGMLWFLYLGVPPGSDPNAEVLVGVTLAVPAVIGLGQLALGVFCFRKSRRLSKEIDRIVRPDTVSAAGLPREPTVDSDPKFLAEEFRNRRESAVTVLRRKRVRAWVEGAILSGVGAALAAPAVWFWFYSHGSDLGPGVPWLAVALVGGLLNMVGGVGLLVLVVGIADFGRAWQLSGQIKQIMNSDTPPQSGNRSAAASISPNSARTGSSKS